MTTQIERINGNLNVVLAQVEDAFSSAKLLAMSPGVALPSRKEAQKHVARLTRVMELVELIIDDVNRMQNLVELKSLSLKTYDAVVAYVNAHRAERNTFHTDWYDNEDAADANDRRWAAMGGSKN
jgi:hypothetical protein